MTDWQDRALAAEERARSLGAELLEAIEDGNSLRDRAIERTVRAQTLAEVLRELADAVFGEAGSEPNVYADHDRLVDLERRTRAALTPRPEAKTDE